MLLVPLVPLVHTITKGTKRTLVPLEHAIVSSLRTLLHALSTLSTLRSLLHALSTLSTSVPYYMSLVP